VKLNHHHFTFFFNLGAFLLRFARTRFTQTLKTELFLKNGLPKEGLSASLPKIEGEQPA